MTSASPPEEPPAVAVSAPRPGSSPAIWLGVLAIVLGGLAYVLPLTASTLTTKNGYTAMWLALPGLVIGILGASGRRRARALAVGGSVLCVVALGVAAAVILVAPTASTGDQTADVLRNDLDVQ